MWSIAVYDLKLTSKEFWALTPAQFFALLDRFYIDIYRADYRNGIVACIIANVNRKEGAPPFAPEDFAPSSDMVELEKQEPTPDDLLKQFKLILGAQIN